MKTKEILTITYRFYDLTINRLLPTYYAKVFANVEEYNTFALDKLEDGLLIYPVNITTIKI